MPEQPPKELVATLESLGLATAEQVARMGRRVRRLARGLPRFDKDGTCEALPFLRASIARDIIRERRELGLTQVQLAKLAGIRQETLSRLESGKHKPNVRTIERIEAALKRKRPKR